MDHNEQIRHFYHSVSQCVERAAAEYDLAVASAIGVLEMVKLDLFKRESSKQEPPEFPEG